MSAIKFHKASEYKKVFNENGLARQSVLTGEYKDVAIYKCTLAAGAKWEPELYPQQEKVQILLFTEGTGYVPTINAEELLSCPMPPTRFIIDQLLPQGLHILAGATKIGKSWLALALCLCVVKGEALWSFAAQKCGVLYLCLEDSYQRIRCRLLDLTEDAPDTLYFSVMSAQLHNGLEQQIEQFLSEHPNTGLVIIDTLQRVRGSGDNGNPYANDYRDIGALKALADKHRIAILLIHHVRKLKSDDPMDMISGTNGISGATDTNFVLMKTSRSENTATLYCTGRDIVYRELRLEFDSETHLWNLLSDDSPHTAQPDARLLSLLSALLRQQPAINVPAATLLKIIDPDDVEGLTPNLLSRRIRKNVDTLGKNGIMVSFRKSNGERLICLRRADRDANITTANTAPIDPAKGANQ